MTRRSGTRSAFFQFYKTYKQNEQEWLVWLEANATHYKSAEDAWIAFVEERQVNPSFLNVETDFRRAY